MKPKWHLSYDKIVAKQIAKLPDDTRQAVFDSIAYLVRQDNPTAPQHGTAKIEELGAWRIHVDIGRQAYRVLFIIRAGTLVVQGIEYKGNLHLKGVIAKKDRPY